MDTLEELAYETNDGPPFPGYYNFPSDCQQCCSSMKEKKPMIQYFDGNTILFGVSFLMMLLVAYLLSMIWFFLYLVSDICIMFVPLAVMCILFIFNMNMLTLNKIACSFSWFSLYLSLPIFLTFLSYHSLGWNKTGSTNYELD
jgi:hypothetical protein